MIFIRGTKEFFIWFWKVITHFLKLHRSATINTIAAKVVSLITNVLAFIMPLKVVMVAASDGAPSFAPLITPELKFEWIVGLSALAILFYVATLTLDAYAKRQSSKGASAIMVAANTLALGSNHKEEAAGMFERFCQIGAHVIFVMAGLIATAFLNIVLFVYVILFIGGSYAFTALFLSRRIAIKNGRIAYFIRDNSSQYLKIISSIGFFSSFLVILYPFLTSRSGNVLIAIATIVLMRRIFPIVASAAAEARKLLLRRPFIDATLFQEHRLPQLSNRRHETLKELFGGRKREKLVSEQLDERFNPEGKLKVSWVDPILSNVSTFRVRGTGPAAKRTSYLLKVFPHSQLHFLENERHLFNHIPREDLFAPKAIKEFTYGRFQCEVTEYGRGEPMTRKQWSYWEPLIYQHLWSIEPPSALVKAYNQSHLPLADRLTEELVRQIDIAADTRAQKRALAEFKESLGDLRRQLAAYPLTLVNPELTAGATALGENERPLVLSWMRWRLEPLGADIRRWMQPDEVVARLKAAKSVRKDIPDDFGLNQALLVRRCVILLHFVQSSAYRTALSLIMKKVFSENWTAGMEDENDQDNLGDRGPWTGPI